MQDNNVALALNCCPRSEELLGCPEGGAAHWLSNAQKQQIHEIRILVASMHPFAVSTIPPFIELCGDVRLLRFLEGNGNNPMQAAQAFVEALAWRAEHGMDAIRLALHSEWRDDLHSYLESLLPHITLILDHLLLQLNFSFTCPGSDREDEVVEGGHLVTIEHTGLGDPVALLEKLSLDDYLIFAKHNMEHKATLLDRLSRERGHLVKMVAVRDMAGLGRKHIGQQGVSLMTAVSVVQVKF